MPNKLTDAEIKKALECCAESGDFAKTQDEICSPCPYSSYGDCTGLLKANVLDLINRQEEEKQNLKAEKENLVIDLTNAMAKIAGLEKQTEWFTNIGKLYSEIKAEAYKEFVERLCEGRVSNDNTVILAKCLLNELVGEDNGKDL